MKEEQKTDENGGQMENKIERWKKKKKDGRLKLNYISN